MSMSTPSYFGKQRKETPFVSPSLSSISMLSLQSDVVPEITISAS